MTAVEWLFQELDNYYQIKGNVIKKEILKQAKEMEKQQGYSEEEVLSLLYKRDEYNFITNAQSLFDWKTPKEWFEQIKKK